LLEGLTHIWQRWHYWFPPPNQSTPSSFAMCSYRFVVGKDAFGRPCNLSLTNIYLEDDAGKVNEDPFNPFPEDRVAHDKDRFNPFPEDRVVHDKDGPPKPDKKRLVNKHIKACGVATVYHDGRAVLEALQHNPHAMELASDEIRSNRQVAMSAVSMSGQAFSALSEKLKADRAVAFAAVRFSSYALRHAASHLRADPELALEAITHHPAVAKVIAPELLSNEEFVMAAVRQNGHVLEHLAIDFCENIDIVRAAVSQNVHAFRHAAPSICADRSFVLEAASVDFRAFEYADLQLFEDSDVVRVFVQSLMEASLTSEVPLKPYASALRAIGENERVGHQLDPLFDMLDGLKKWNSALLLAQSMGRGHQRAISTLCNCLRNSDLGFQTDVALALKSIAGRGNTQAIAAIRSCMRKPPSIKKTKKNCRPWLRFLDQAKSTLAELEKDDPETI